MSAAEPERKLRLERGLALPILIVALGIAASLLWAGTYAFASRLLRQDRALIRATREISLAIATSHLWLEELISGDHGDRRQIWIPLDEAHDRAQLLLHGGEDPREALVLQPLAEERLRRQVERLSAEIDALRELARVRVEGFDAGRATGPGTGIDARYDALFAQTSATCLELERGFEARMVADDDRARTAFVGLLGLWLLLVAVAATGLWRREVHRDSTEQALRKSEARLLQSQKMDAVGRLAGRLAHDVNNFVTAITSQCELAQLEAGPGSPFTERMKTVIDTANKISSLIRRLLAFSRNQPIQPQVVALNEVVSGLEKMMRGLLGEDLLLTTALAPDLWPVKIDPSQIEQIVVNLLVNAREASPRGGRVTIETANQHVEPGLLEGSDAVPAGDYVQLAVSDTGTGILPELKDRIFEPFFTTKERDGNGLGLATVYGIAQQNGGHVSVYSEVGSGTTFKVYLPRTREEPPPKRAAEPSPVDGRIRERILLVEDNAELREATAGILRALGARIREAASGEEAIAILE
ncbi:MAG TPA: ATP-binding protein, partial [Thermoanaerobaculia bacterium]|nr:ATP-binding protein [Thermoanaerobaculia bacterium]